MPRLTEMPRADVAPEVLPHYERLFGDRDPVSQPGTATGTPGNWWSVMANSPDLLDALVAVMRCFRDERRVVTARQRELAITRTGFVVGSQFVYSQHSKAARAAGISDEELSLLRGGWASSATFPTEDKILLAYVDEFVRGSGRVTDETFDELRTVLDDEGILELTIFIGTYAMHAAIARALRLEYDDVDERVVEVPAPEAGAGGTDILSDITGR